MDWPSTPVEHRAAFQPPFCPWRDCTQHRRTRPGYRFRRYGFFSTQRRRRVPRFLCLTCRRTFSRQTFSTSYYLKRPGLLGAVCAGLVAGSALRQIARSSGCAPNTAARLSARLGRHALLLHAEALASLRERLDEPVVLDHFETFEFTQDYPFGLATPVGAESWFVYGLDPAPHPRTGRRSPAQQRRLDARPPRALRGGYAGSTRRVLDLLLSLGLPETPLVVRTDGHPDYARAVAAHPDRGRLRLECFPNPPRGRKGEPRSRQAGARDRAMFPADLLHKILRHSVAHHRRETIAFGRRLNALVERAFLVLVWRNFVKRRSERRRTTAPTPAMERGLTDRPWSWKRILARRLFPDRREIPGVWRTLYRRGWTTPLLPRNASHALRRAF